MGILWGTPWKALGFASWINGRKTKLLCGVQDEAKILCLVSVGVKNMNDTYEDRQSTMESCSKAQEQFQSCVGVRLWLNGTTHDLHAEGSRFNPPHCQVRLRMSPSQLVIQGLLGAVSDDRGGAGLGIPSILLVMMQSPGSKESWELADKIVRLNPIGWDSWGQDWP